LLCENYYYKLTWVTPNHGESIQDNKRPILCQWIYYRNRSKHIHISITKPKRRRTKKQRASDKRSSEAFRRANELGRKKDGSFKAGYDQARIASVAQRLKKKM